MHTRYKDQVAFLGVYVREATPPTVGGPSRRARRPVT